MKTTQVQRNKHNNLYALVCLFIGTVVMTEQKTGPKKKQNKKIREEPNPVHRSHSNVSQLSHLNTFHPSKWLDSPANNTFQNEC